MQSVELGSCKFISNSTIPNNIDIDVWVGNDILGKDYIEAYYDHDDPNEWDVWPIMGHSGKFKINVASQWYEEDSTDNTLQQLVKSDNFQNWLKEYNIEKVFIVGGRSIYKLFFNCANFLHMTKIDLLEPGINEFFPIKLNQIKNDFIQISERKIALNAKYTLWNKKNYS